MTKKMISWLAGMAVFLILSSCRNDIFPEKEALQNTGSFQLTSQRISLAESKHKLKLTPELSKAENFLKSLKTNVSGKTFSYGNGVSIDTDDVIYIENGPDYHTYTFHIKRENAHENAPLENLVLSPLSDGSYRELLFTYDLSSAEKQDIIQGIPVDTKGKVSVTELAKGTYNTGGQLARTTCNWQEKTVWVSCSEGLHDGSNFHQCYFVNHPSEGTPPRAYTVEEYVCLLETDQGPGGMDSGGGGGGSSGSGGGGGDTPSNPPCNGTGILTQPQQPGITDADGCSGIPTQPNLPDPRNNPCAKTKNMLKRPIPQQIINNVEAQALTTLSNVYAGEIGFKEKKDGTIAPSDVNAAHKVIFNDVTDGYGGYHNHTANGAHMFSPPDIADTLLGFAAAQDNVGDAYFGMIAAEWCTTCPNNKKILHYVIQYTGEATHLGNGGSYNFTALQVKQFENSYLQIVGDLADIALNGTTYVKNSAGDLNEKGLEKLFFETLKIMGMNGKVNLQRIEPNGTIYNVTLDSNNMPVGIPCP